MKTRTLKIIFCIGIFLIALVNIQAQNEITLDSLLAQSLRNNPQLHASRFRVQSMQTRITQVQSWDDPTFAFEFYQTPVNSLNPFKDGMETDYSIQQMIPFPGKKSLMGNMVRANVKMIEQSTATLIRKIIADVKSTFAMLYSIQKRIEVNTENQRLVKQIIETARTKYSVGLLTQGDVLKAELELAKLQNEQSSLEEELHTAEAMMNALRAVPSSTYVGRVADISPVDFKSSFDEIKNRALTTRSEIQSMKYEIEMNKAELAVSQRERLPDFMVRGMYKRMNMGTDFWSAMIGINIPIAPWASEKYSAKIEENELNIRANEQSLIEMQNMVQMEVRSAWQKTKSRWEQVKRYQTIILPQAEQSFQATLVAYQTDKTNFLSLLDSYRMLQMFKMEYYMLVGEYFSDTAMLEKAIGGSIE